VRMGDAVAEARLGTGQLAVGGHVTTCLSQRGPLLVMEIILI
jgi:hypothetical protein